MITALEVDNFKGIGRPIRIELRPITLFFGRNSAGKSTILHALHYAHEILSRRNLDPDATHHGGDVVDLGGFRSFVHAQDTSRVVRLRFELDLTKHELPELPMLESAADADEAEELQSLELFDEGLSTEIRSGWVELQVRWSGARKAPTLRTYEVGMNGEVIGRIESNDDGAQVDLFPNLAHPLFAYDGRIPEEERPSREEVASRWISDTPGSEAEYWRGHRLPVGGLARSSLPRWGELLALDYDEQDDFYAYPFREFRYRVSTLMVGLGQLLKDEVAQLRYVGPMRDVLARTYASPRYLEPHRWASGLGAWDRMHTLGPEFVAGVSDWLSDSEKLDTGYGLALRSFIELPEDSALWLSIERGTFLDMWDDLAAEFQSLEKRTAFRLVDPTSRIAVHPADVGVGVSQVVPVVVAALDPDRPSLTAIEQPELHIHPKVQVGLGDLFASQIGDGTRRFLLETHSEHLMLRLLRRIEETHSGDLPPGAPALRPDQVAVVFIEQIEGEVKATQLRIDESGEFVDRWPHGFFEERAEELL